MTSEYVERLMEYIPKLTESLNETSIMLGFASIAAILLGLPLGTVVYLTSKDKPLDKTTKSIAICPICGKEFKTYERKIYCSDECKYKSKNYPSIEEVNE